MFASKGDKFKNRYSGSKCEVLAVKLDLPKKIKSHKDVKFAYLTVNPEIEDVRKYNPKWVKETSLRSNWSRL